MRQGRHFLADGITETHDPSTPVFIQTDNMDFQKNMEITDVQIMYASAEPGNKDFSNDIIMFVLARTEEAATPQAIVGTSSRLPTMGLRFNDPDIIAWGTLDAEQGAKVIVSPYNIVPTNMWVNAWSLSNAHALDPVSNAIGYAIWMRMKKQSGTEGLLQTTLNVAAQENS